MQFQVPQNIAMEDRIVGPFTTIQFVILVIGGGISFYVATSLGLPSPVNNFVGFGLALITFILAVGKFNDQPMYRFFRHLISYIFQPKTRVWRKQGSDVQLIKPETTAQREEKRHVPKHVSRQDIARLAVVLDSRGSAGVVPRRGTTPEQSPAVSPTEPTNTSGNG